MSTESRESLLILSPAASSRLQASDQKSTSYVDCSRQFGQGCDARLSGWSVWANPYTDAQPLFRRAWANGWRDVHVFWGSERCVRWRHQQLPAVRETARDHAVSLGLTKR